MRWSKLAFSFLITLFLIISPALALTITLNYPPNNAQTIDTTPTFNFTPTGSSSSYNCTLYIDGTNYGEATNIPNNTAAEITPTSALSLGDHNWNITCEGVGTTETGTSETRVIGIGENFSRCAIFIDPGTYKLTADIVNSSTSKCLNLYVNDIVLDCQGHLVDGDDVADYGIYIYRSSAQTTNITIKNCIVKDWDTTNIYLKYAKGNTLENIVTNSSPDYGIRLDSSNSNTLINITAYSNNYDGIFLESSNFNILSNLTTYSNIDGIYLEFSDSNTLTNITSYSNNFGIYLYYSDSNTLSNIIIYSNNYDGVFLDSSSSNTLTNLTTYSNIDGIYLEFSDSNTLTNITSYSNDFGIYFDLSSSNTLTNINTTDNIKYDIYYAASSSSYCSAIFETVIGTGNRPIVFYNSSVTIKDWNNNVSEIIFCNADNSLIDNLTLIGNENNGLILTGGTENTIIKNSYFQDLENGILLTYSSSNTLTNITTISNVEGIYLKYSDSNILSNITTHSNYDGIYFRSSDSNTIKSSKIWNNSQYGIYLYSAGEDGPNLIYNNFFNNTNNFYFGGTVYSNQWNTTLQSDKNIVGGGFIAGNFWAKPDGTGFSQTCNDTNLDGICDDPYTLESNNTDYLPLSPYYDGTPPEITFLTAGAHSPGNVTVKFEAKDNIINCTLKINGTTYPLHQDGNIFWTYITLTKDTWAIATCWDPADWRINNTTVSAAYLIAGGVGGMGGGAVPVFRTHYTLSFTVATPTPATIYIYTPEGKLIKKLEDVSGFTHTYLPEGDYVVKVVTEGGVRTYEITLDRPKAIAITPQTISSRELGMLLIVLLLLGFLFLKIRVLD